jgi:anti-sigma-K factor RskA
MNYLMPERLDRLAREYALGTLAGRARRRFERVLAASGAATMAVRVWQHRLAVLEGASIPLAPPVGNWPAIERRLFAPAVATGAPIAARRGARGSRGWLSGVLPAWTVGAALLGALACALALRIVPGLSDFGSGGAVLPASYVGLLQDDAGRPMLVVSSLRQGRVATLKLLQPMAVPAGRVAELWALPQDGRPFLVGTLPARGSAGVPLPATSEQLFAHVSDLGVSLEPAGAAPAAPTAPFVLTGHCIKVW